jgi:hypothetical protein
MEAESMTEETLSDKRIYTFNGNLDETPKYCYPEEDVKELIRKLNKIARNNGQLNGFNFVHIKDINKLAGEKLI